MRRGIFVLVLVVAICFSQAAWALLVDFAPTQSEKQSILPVAPSSSQAFRPSPLDVIPFIETDSTIDEYIQLALEQGEVGLKIRDEEQEVDIPFYLYGELENIGSYLKLNNGIVAIFDSTKFDEVRFNEYNRIMGYKDGMLKETDILPKFILKVKDSQIIHIFRWDRETNVFSESDTQRVNQIIGRLNELRLHGDVEDISEWQALLRELESFDSDLAKIVEKTDPLFINIATLTTIDIHIPEEVPSNITPVNPAEGWPIPLPVDPRVHDLPSPGKAKARIILKNLSIEDENLKNYIINEDYESAIHYYRRNYGMNQNSKFLIQWLTPKSRVKQLVTEGDEDRIKEKFPRIIELERKYDKNDKPALSHFIIYYTVEDPDNAVYYPPLNPPADFEFEIEPTDADENGYPDKIEILADDLEKYGWKMLVDDWGFEELQEIMDPALKGPYEVAIYDVYPSMDFYNQSEKIVFSDSVGLVTIDGIGLQDQDISQSNGITGMAINSHFTEGYAPYYPYWYIREGIPHELIHSYQVLVSGTGSKIATWIGEGTASLAEMLIDGPQINRTERGLVNLKLITMDYSLNDFSYSNWVQYGTVLFWRYIYDQFGGWEAIRGVWDEFKDKEDIPALENFLSQYGLNFKEVFNNWLIAVGGMKYDKAPELGAEYSFYPEAKRVFIDYLWYEEIPRRFGESINVNDKIEFQEIEVKPFAAKYYKTLKLNDNSMFAPEIKSIKFNITSSGDATYHILLFKDNTLVDVISSSSTEFEEIISREEYDEIMLILAGGYESASYDFSVTFLP